MLNKLLYRYLKEDMVKKLRQKHGEQFIDDVMETFGMPTNYLRDGLPGSFRNNFLPTK
jgi:hypothetical protein